MKKFMLFLIIASAFAGCGQTNDGNKQGAKENTAAQTQTGNTNSQETKETKQNENNTAEWNNEGINAKTTTIFNENGDTKYLKVAELDAKFNEKAANKEMVELGYVDVPKEKDGDKEVKIWRSFYGNQFAINKNAELEKIEKEKKGDKASITAFDSAFDKKPIYMDILVVDTKGEKPQGMVAFTFFTKEQIKKMGDIIVKVGGSTITLKENEILASKGFEKGSTIICNSITANLTPEFFTALSKMKNNEKVSITFKADGKDIAYEYTYNADANKLYVPLMKFNQLNK